jgi:putative ABC transport system permease protein
VPWKPKDTDAPAGIEAFQLTGVAEAEARRTISVRVKTGPDAWKSMRLFAIPDFDNMRIYKARRLSGEWPPKAHELLLERAASAYLGIGAGQSMLN